jgi:16S rRNA processing protein RimM
MNINACFELGYITKKHGLQGEVSIHLDTDNPENYSELESVFVEIDQKLVPFFIESLSIRGEKALVKFEGVEDAEGAEELKGSKLFLPLENLPPLEGKTFYFHEVIGFRITDRSFGLIGTVTDIYDVSAQQLFAIDHKGKEVLVPVNDEIIEQVDRSEKIIHVDLPEGLIDIFLE